MEDTLRSLRADLKSMTDAKTIAGAQNFFKEEIKIYGVKISAVTLLSRKYYKEHLKNLNKNTIFKLCEKLWQSGYMEEAFIACNWSYYAKDKYEEKDFKTFARWVKKYVTNWATCDTLCNHTVADLLEKYPHYITNLKTWAKSKNRWVKRGAAVTLILPARKGLFLPDIFEIADTLLTDPDDMVQKGYGWMLKAASQAHQKEVFNYVIKHKAVMPRTALRYAIEKMPQNLKQKAMEK
ncbi:3-methyladenine DNA glycosylase AlkD [Elusimicrobium simillimum]|uniref:DNA alkylation repair protein n=1 Tax=Elusimicrobium simillimum TaxID=3143438 RepID=UPI003C6EEE39